MKNKKNLYFLIPTVLFIWGFIIYRIVDFTSEGETDYAPKTYATPLRETRENEQYQLKARYPDPFLKQLAGTAIDSGDEEVEIEEAAPQTENAVDAQQSPDILYRGFINESGTDARIALLVIEGKEVFLKSGTPFQAYVIDQIKRDSVAISSETGSHWVRKE